MTPNTQLLLYCLLVILASLLGGWLPQVAKLSHKRMQLLMSFVAGLMLGVGAFHMLVHAAVETHSLDQAVWWMMVGLLLMFFLQRFFHFHQHGPGDLASLPLTADLEAAHEPGHGPACDHGPHADHHHHHEHGHTHGPGRSHAFSWLGLTIGLLVHTLLDGVALAASVEVESGGASTVGVFGLGTFLAVILHKPLDAMAVTSLMMTGGWSVRWRQLVNGMFALVVPIGAGAFHLGVNRLADEHHAVLGCALAFSAGTFLCIALSDLLPEIQFHSHDRLKLSLALLLGLAAAYGIGFLETHGHEHHGHQNHGHEGQGHDAHGHSSEGQHAH